MVPGQARRVSLSRWAGQGRGLRRRGKEEEEGGASSAEGGWELTLLVRMDPLACITASEVKFCHGIGVREEKVSAKVLSGSMRSFSERDWCGDRDLTTRQERPSIVPPDERWLSSLPSTGQTKIGPGPAALDRTAALLLADPLLASSSPLLFRSAQSSFVGPPPPCPHSLPHRHTQPCKPLGEYSSDDDDMTYLGSDELETGELPPGLLLDELGHLGVLLLNRRVQRRVLKGHQQKRQEVSTLNHIVSVLLWRASA